MNVFSHQASLVKAPRVLDLFSGCGGLSHGLAEAGFEIVAGIDNWNDALTTFAYNHPGAKTMMLDLAEFEPSSIAETVGTDIDVVVGGPPCQGFSISGKRNPKDPRNRLYTGFVDVVEYFQPRAFIMENVPNLLSMAGGRVRAEIVREFEELGYAVDYKVLLASDYGVPQNRRRVFFVGVRDGDGFEFPEATHLDDKVTTEEAISDLPEGSVEDGSPYLFPPSSGYQVAIRNSKIGVYNHVITNHHPRTVEVISKVPDGGNYKDLPEELKSIRKVNIAWTRYSSTKPSHTIDTGHRHHFHYRFNRVPTVRESARLQSFPDEFIFKGSKTSQYKQVGNAVPPILAATLGSSLLAAFGKKSR